MVNILVLSLMKCILCALNVINTKKNNLKYGSNWNSIFAINVKLVFQLNVEGFFFTFSEVGSTTFASSATRRTKANHPGSQNFGRSYVPIRTSSNTGSFPE